MMINVVALSLVLSSLVTSCVFSPGPFSPTQETHTPKQDDVVIVKEGHRAVIVEYEKEGTDGNTKVSISPKPISGEEELSTAAAATTAKDAAEEVKERGRVYTIILEVLKYGKEPNSTTTNIHISALKQFSVEHRLHLKNRQTGRGPRELACDAFGKCEHRIASVIGKAKEKVTEKVYAVEEGAKEAVGEVVGKAKETLSHATGDVSEIAKDTAEKAKTMGKDVQRNVSVTIESAKEKTKEKAEKGKEMAEQVAERARTGRNRVKEGGEKVFKEILCRGRDVAAAMDWVVGVVHLLGFSTAYGICLWVTFVSGYVLAGTLPRQQFAMVQSRIYPVYFRVMAISVCVALVWHLLGRRGKLFTSKGEMLQGFHLLASLLMILINSFYLEPRATKVVFEKMKFEKEEGRVRVDPVSVIPATPARGTTTTTAEPILTPPASIPAKPDQDKVKSRIFKLNERLKKLNSVSSMLNIFTLVALTWHLVYLGQRLHLSC